VLPPLVLLPLQQPHCLLAHAVLTLGALVCLLPWGLQIQACLTGVVSCCCWEGGLLLLLLLACAC
jgi:hypothetical protein